MANLPLISQRRLDAAFAYRDGLCISVREYLSDVTALAASLPDRAAILNVCADRYRFCVGLGAALSRGQVTLLPPNLAPQLLTRLKDLYSGLYALADGDESYSQADTLHYPAELTRQSVTAPPSFPPDRIATIVFTSGSTGEPLANTKTWGSLVQSAQDEAVRFELNGRDGPTLIGTVPPQHMYGFESTVLLPLQNGLAFHAARPFFADDVRRALADVPAPRGLVTTPVHLRALVEDDTALPELKLIVCATAPLGKDLARRAEQRFGAPLIEIYGCTEAGQLAARRTVTCDRWRVLGAISLFQDPRGTLANGGHVQRETLLNDVIELHSPQTFSLHGRLGDVVNIAGKRTSLANLNFQLTSIAGVRDAVFFLPDAAAETMTRLVAFVVAPGMSAEAIVAELRTRIDAAFLPRPIYLVDALPRNLTGKLPLAALRDLAAKLTAK